MVELARIIYEVLELKWCGSEVLESGVAALSGAWSIGMSGYNRQWTREQDDGEGYSQ